MSNLSALRSSVDKILKNRVVLVVDSHPFQRSITRTILLQLGVKITREINDGFGAVDAICTFDPCAMILDWAVRGMDAREVVRVVRTSGMVPNPRMPIITIGSPPPKSKVIEAKNLGIEHYLIRPISPMLLGEHLFPALRKSVQPSSDLGADGIDLLTPEKVAEILKVSTSWLTEARTKGDGPPHIRVGRFTRYSETALNAWIKSQESTSTSEQESPTPKPKKA